MNVPAVSYSIIYDGRDITKNISQYIESVTYTDALEGQSDEVQIVLDDSTAIWQNAWYPNKGSILKVTIGVMNCGEFQIDEFVSSGGAGVASLFTIKALAVGKNSPIRTEKSYIHENKTLKEVVTTFCEEYNYTLDGTIEDIKFDRLNQNRVTSLGFIATLASKFGHIFSVRNKKVTFTEQIAFETERGVTYNLTKGDYDFWNFKDKTEGTFATAQVEYFDPTAGSYITGTCNSNSFPNFKNNFKSGNAEGQVVTGFFNPDSYKVYETVENQGQADRLCKSALYRNNSEFRTGTLGMKGNEKYIAGLIINVQGVGLFSGNYIIVSSSHKIDKNSGYRTDLSLKHSNYSEVVSTEENN